MLRARRVALVATLSLLLGLGACLPRDPTAPAGGTGARATLLVRADVTNTPVATVVVEVTASDIPTTLVFNIPIAAGIASGAITVPTGSDRRIRIRAFDLGDVEVDTGSVTMPIQPGTNPPVSIVLTPLVSSVPIVVTLGSFVVAVTPAVDTLVAGDTVTLTATILDTQGNPVAGQVVWATLVPGVATIVSTGSQTGRVTALGAGLATVVATFGGTAALATIVASTPGGLWAHEPPGLFGLADTSGHRDHDFVLEDVNGTVETASGWSNSYPDDFAVTGQLALISDPTAPFPNSVAQVTYPIGWDEGAAPGQVGYEHRSVTEYYLAFYFKISKPYQSVGGGHNKIAYIYTPDRDLVLEFTPNGNNWNFFMAEYVSDSAGNEIDHYGTFTAVSGAWYKIELSMSYSNSRIKWWINDTLDQDFPCDFNSNAGGGLNALQLSPTYGGGGLPAKTEVDYVWYDHIHMSGSP